MADRDDTTTREAVAGVEGEYAWVIVDSRFPAPHVRYYAAIGGNDFGEAWTMDSLKAIRFCRKIDADRVIGGFPRGEGWHLTAEQHAWPELATPRPDAASASVTEAMVQAAEDELAKAIGALPLPWGTSELEPHLSRITRAKDRLIALAAAPRDAGLGGEKMTALEEASLRKLEAEVEFAELSLLERREVSDAEVEAADKSWLRDASDSLRAALRGFTDVRTDEATNRDRRARMKRALEAARAARRGATS